MTRKEIKPATRVVGAGRRKQWTQGVVNPPVWRASTILYDSIADMRETGRGDTHHKLYYGRRGTPTQWALADALTELEPGAEGTFLYCSGVAAIAAALLSVLQTGDELLLVDSAYEPTRAMARGLLERFGITTRFYDPMIGAGIADLIGERTRAILMESPGSLTFEVQDIPAIVAAAKARGIVTLLDNTWATPLYFKPLDHGVDISIHAVTKYPAGHSDILMGTVSANEKHWKQLLDAHGQLGICGAPDDAYQVLRGLRTMGVRLERHQESALAIAEWLEGREEVARVLHPALPSFPGHEIWKRDFKGASGIFSFVLAVDDPQKFKVKAHAFLDALRIFGLGYSWGGFESLALQVNLNDRRVAKAPTEGPVLRLQIGLEDVVDLKVDIEKGLAAAKAA